MHSPTLFLKHCQFESNQYCHDPVPLRTFSASAAPSVTFQPLPRPFTASTMASNSKPPSADLSTSQTAARSESCWLVSDLWWRQHQRFVGFFTLTTLRRAGMWQGCEAFVPCICGWRSTGYAVHEYAAALRA